MTEDRIKTIKYVLNNILDQQILISQLSKGITYQDTENMDEYERSYIINKLLEMKKEENEIKLKALKNKQNQ